MARKRRPGRRAQTKRGRTDSESEAPKVDRRWDWAWNLGAVVGIGAVLFVVYFGVLDAPFVYDDEITIESNSSIARLWPLVGDGRNPGPLNPAKNLPTAGRPLVNLSFAFNYWWGKLEPAGYRALNLAIHYLSAMLLMVIVRRTLRLPYFGGRLAGSAAPLAMATAVLWAVHPLNTEAVAYITQRTELLMAFCFLGTLYAAMRYWEANGRHAGGSPRSIPATLSAVWLAIAVLACAAGMASKEVMVAAPIVVLMYEWTFMRGSVREIGRRSWRLYVGLAATWLLLWALN